MAGIIIIIPTFFYLIIRIPEVQTFVVKRITSHLSNEFKTTISVSQIEYTFFNKLTINDLLIKDSNNDTLIYSQKVITGIRKMDFRNRSFKLGKVILERPVVAFIIDSAGVMNLTWYLDMLRTSKDTLKKESSTYVINQIEIKEARFSLLNKSGSENKMMIDFNNLMLSGINGSLEDLKVQNDSIIFDIKDLSFRESTGFVVKSLNTSVMLADQDIIFNSLFLNCDSSIINADHIGLYPDSSTSFRKFTEEVRLDILLRKSLINSSDLQYFLSFIKGMDESVWLSGKVTGTVSELKGRNIELTYSENTYLDCDFDFSGLPEIENAFIYIGVNNLKTNAKDIENIRISEKEKIIIPEVIYKLGNISFDGSFTGFTTDFVTYGKFRTSKGNLRTDISMRPEDKNRFRVKGLISGSNVDLGEISGNPELLGKLSMETNVDGYAYSISKFAGNLTGLIDSIEIKNYIYRNIAFNGVFTEKTWDGSIKITDDNIRMDLLGMFNFSEKLPEFNFTLNLAEANLNKLNFDESDTTSLLTMLMTANFKGNNIDNLDGEIKLLNSTLRKYNNRLDLYDFSIRAFTEEGKPAISLRTDFMDADLRGYYNFAEFGTIIKSTLAALMPSVFPAPKVENKQRKNSFTFNVNFKNTDKINNFFRTGVLLADKRNINGAIFADTIIIINGRAKTLNVKNFVFSDFLIDANISGQTLSAGLNSSSLTLLGQSELKDFSAGLNTKPDNFIFSVDWDNKDKVLNKGNFIARGIINKEDKERLNPVLKIDIDSSDIYSRNNLWRLNHSVILVDSNSIDINKLYIGNKDHYYLVDGAISEDPSDTLNMEFKGIDLYPLNYLWKKNTADNETSIPLELKGIISGNILLTNIYKNIMLESNIKVNNFSLLGSEYGEISAESVWNNTKKVADISASNNLKGVKMFDLKGFYDPETKRINLDAKADKLPIDALNPLLNSFASGINGLASGKVNLSGEFNKLVLTGAILAENASMKIDYLQTIYKLNDTIRFDKNGIKFNAIRLTDEKGNFATLSGSVNHKYFKDYSADLLINTNECLVLNTKPKDNELFYGTVYATGVTTIKSGPTFLSFDISAKTGKNTKFFIPLNTGLSVSDYSFIAFVDSDTTVIIDKNKANSVTLPVAQTGLELNFDLEVTPDAEVQLIIDSKAGDVMKGHGSGNLNVNLNQKGDFKISGDYIIEDGDYLFTLGNILNKPFSVENGGKITFNGDLENAEIDIKAIYKLRASLYAILQDEKYNERIPVECQLNLSGKLLNPIVGLNIFLPMADEETRTYLKNAITTEEELSRQFLYLLVMNSFYSDPSYHSSLGTTNTSTSAMAITTTEMLSNQLSNWLSQISNDFDIGFVYRPGDKKDINSQEVQVALSTQLMNDKVLINGNFDVRGAGNNYGNPITGDFDIEYKIAEKIRFKVFNRFNNPYTGKGVPYTQGFGILFKQDFNKFSDLLKKKDKSEMKKEDELIVK